MCSLQKKFCQDFCLDLRRLILYFLLPRLCQARLRYNAFNQRRRHSANLLREGLTRLTKANASVNNGFPFIVVNRLGVDKTGG